MRQIIHSSVKSLADLELDAAWCINLKRRKDRRKKAEAEIVKLGIDVQIVDAVDADRLSLQSAKDFTAGMVGCYLSHIMLLKMALIAGYDRILIMEDDCTLITGGNALLGMALPVLPNDWQFAWLGYTVVESERKRTKVVNDFWCVPGGSWGTQCYMINGRDAIRKLLDGLATMNLQIDIQLSHHVLPRSGLKYYGITPSCMRQNFNMGSDVQTK
jgi:GR25 family glycosyltransferase involved in LPS biosynthesis